MRYLFYGCSSLKELPVISNWNMENVYDISYMFYSRSSLKSLPNISEWNTKNIYNLNSIFENCTLLTIIPNISKWKFNKRIKINNIFRGCNSFLIIPDISKWNINIPQEYFDNSSSKSNSFSNKDIIRNSSLSEGLSFSIDNDNISLSENINYIDFFNKNDEEELNDYYDNFYN